MVKEACDEDGIHEPDIFTEFGKYTVGAVSYTHLRAHETVLDLVCRLMLETKLPNCTHTPA